MVKQSSTATPPREPIKTRKKSARSERKNSVSDIAEFFSSKMTGTNSNPNSNGKSTKTPKVKEKEREQKTQTTPKTPTDLNNSETNTEKGDSWADKAEAETSANKANDLDNHVDHQPISPQLTSKQTQTSEDAVLLELREIKQKLQSLDKDINDPRNGVSTQLAKMTSRVDSLHSDIHGAVSGIKVKMATMEKDLQNTSATVTSLGQKYSTLSKLLDENKRLMNELPLLCKA